MYRMKRPVTYSEVGADYRADMAQIINYFQDCSCFQSDELGVGPEKYGDFGKSLDVEQLAGCCENDIRSMANRLR